MDHVKPMLAQIICDSTSEKGIIARFAMAISGIFIKKVTKFIYIYIFKKEKFHQISQLKIIVIIFSTAIKAQPAVTKKDPEKTDHLKILYYLGM